MFKPLGSRVLVLSDPKKEIASPSGIVISLATHEASGPSFGSVIAVGPGTRLDGEDRPVAVKVGDRVLYGKYAGTKMTINDKDHVLLDEKEIFGVDQ